MNTRIRKSLMLGKSLLIALMAIGSFTACSDDDDNVNLTALSTPSSENVVATVYTLTFSWDKVANATQYAYELKNEAGEVVSGDMTTSTSVYFSGLNDGATYTLDVWAYAKAYSDQYTKSKVATFTGTTIATKTLAAPENVAVSVTEDKATITWNAVDHAQAYAVILDGGTSSSARSTQTTLTGLSVGSHTVTVYATSQDEEYPRADSTTVSFEVEEFRTLLGKRTVSFTCGLGRNLSREVLIYDDGSYSIQNWYGVEGYNFDFKIENGKLVITNGYDMTTGGYNYTWVATTSDSDGVWLMPDYQGAQTAAGYVYFYVWDSNNQTYIQFTLDTTINDFPGNYTDESFQWYENAWSSWGKKPVTVKLSDDGKLIFNGVAQNYTDWEAEVEVDEKGYVTGNIIFKGGQVCWKFYTLGDYSADGNDVTATFDNALNITLPSYALWYGGWAYYYMYTELTRN